MALKYFAKRALFTRWYYLSKNTTIVRPTGSTAYFTEFGDYSIAFGKVAVLKLLNFNDLNDPYMTLDLSTSKFYDKLESESLHQNLVEVADSVWQK